MKKVLQTLAVTLDYDKSLFYDKKNKVNDLNFMCSKVVLLKSIYKKGCKGHAHQLFNFDQEIKVKDSFGQN